MNASSTGTFRSLGNRNFRLWIASNLFSNIGAWMQGTAQTWLVLTELTDHSAAAVGIVTALQFAPQLMLVPFTGTAADHIDRRKLLIAIQCGMAFLALALGLATISGVVRLWHVYVLAFFLGCGMALFIFRAREGRPEGFRVPLYPVVPLVFCATCAYMLYSSVNYVRFAVSFGGAVLLGIVVMALGIPLYFLARRK